VQPVTGEEPDSNGWSQREGVVQRRGRSGVGSMRVGPARHAGTSDCPHEDADEAPTPVLCNSQLPTPNAGRQNDSACCSLDVGSCQSAFRQPPALQDAEEVVASTPNLQTPTPRFATILGGSWELGVGRWEVGVLSLECPSGRARGRARGASGRSLRGSGAARSIGAGRAGCGPAALLRRTDGGTAGTPGARTAR